MKDPDLISEYRPRAAQTAFSLIEVVVALGLFAVTVVGVLALQTAIGESVAGIAAHSRAAQLGDALTIELRRICILSAAEGRAAGLDGLAALVPSSDSAPPLKLVASRDGLRVVRESEVDATEIGIKPQDRFYLIEVRQHAGPLEYASASGFLAATAAVKWPYSLATAEDLGARDSAGIATVVLNLALTP